MIQGLLVLNLDNYAPLPWQSTLLGYAILALCLLLNTVGATILPKLEGVILILHILGFFAILIPLLHLAPRSKPEFVFGHLEVLSGWKNNGLSWFIGLSGSLFTFIGKRTRSELVRCGLLISVIGFDGPCHMAEEIEKASTVVPWCMMVTVFVNGALGFAMVLAFLFSIGDMHAALDSPTHYDFIHVLYNATG